MLQKSFFTSAAVIGFFLLAPASSHAVAIKLPGYGNVQGMNLDFDNYVVEGVNINQIQSPINNSGWIISGILQDGTTPTVFGVTNPSNYGFSALDEGYCSTTFSLTREDNIFFTFESIDVYSADSWPVEVVFKGILASGKHVSKKIKMNVASGWSRFKLPPSFSGLKSVSWINGDCSTTGRILVDNIVVYPTW